MFSLFVLICCVIGAFADFKASEEYGLPKSFEVYGVPKSYSAPITPLVNKYAYAIPAEAPKVRSEYGVPKIHSEYGVPKKVHSEYIVPHAPLRIYNEPIINKYAFDIPAQVKLAPYSPAEVYGAPLRTYAKSQEVYGVPQVKIVKPQEVYGAPLRTYAAPVVSKYAYDIPAEAPKVKLAPYPAAQVKLAPYPQAVPVPHEAYGTSALRAPIVKSEYSYDIPKVVLKLAKPHDVYGVPSF